MSCEHKEYIVKPVKCFGDSKNKHDQIIISNRHSHFVVFWVTSKYKAAGRCIQIILDYSVK